MQENLLIFNNRKKATLKETTAVRNAAMTIGLKTDDLTYWIEKGIIPLTEKENRLLKENVEKLVILRNTLIGFNEYSRSHETEHFNPRLAGHRNKLMDYLEANAFFDVEFYYSNNIPLLLPTREVLYFEREKINLLDAKCNDFFSEFGLTEKQKIQKLRNEAINKDVRNYIDTYLRLKELNDILPLPSETSAIRQISQIRDLKKIDEDFIRESMNNAQTENEKSELSKFYNEIAKVKNLRYSAVSLPVRKEPKIRRNSAYTYIEYCMFADIIFHEQYIEKNHLIEKALAKPFYAEKWLYYAAHYICSWRGESICDDWQHLELDREDCVININKDSLEKDILKNRIDKEIYRKCLRYSIGKLNAKCRQPHKTIKYDPTYLFVEGMPVDLEHFFGRLLLICEVHHLRNKQKGYLDKNRIDRYQNWVSNKDFFGEDVYELFGPHNITNTKLRSCFIQGTECKNREDGEDAISSISIASFSCNHMSINTTSKYLRDHNFTGQTPEFIAYNIMQMGPLSALPDAAFRLAYADRYESLPIVERSTIIKETRLDIEQLDDSVGAVLLGENFIKVLAEMNTPQAKRVLNMMFEFGQHRGKAKDEGVYCIRRGQGQSCINPGCKSCIAEMCEFCVFTEVGIKSVRKVIDGYEEKYRISRNEKYLIVLNTQFIPWITTILKPLTVL